MPSVTDQHSASAPASSPGARRRRSGGRAAVGVFAAFMLLGSGCGSTDDAASDDAVVEYGNQQYGESFTSGPLAKFMGMDDPKGQQAQFQEQNRKAQESIAACMTAQGFEYIASTQSSGFVDTGDLYGDLTVKEYAEKWGYGYSTMMSADGSPVEGAPGMSAPSEEQQDPNMKIREAMSESEGQAYDQALYGAMLTEDGGDPSESADTGCQGKAYESASDPKTDEKLQKAYEQLSKRLEADGRTKAATKAYRACMREAGYPEIRSPEQTFETVSKKMDKLYESMSNGSDGTDGSDGSGGSDGSDGSDGVTDTTLEGTDSGAAVAGDGSIDSSGGSTVVSVGGEDGGMNIDPKELKKVQKFELALAKAEFPCRAAHDLAVAKVSAEYEQDFIDKNRELLEQSRDALGAG